MRGETASCGTRFRGKTLAIAAVLGLLFPVRGNCAQIDSQTAEKVIVGEAADQGLDGMIAVAEVIRNRGSLHGFASLKNKNLDKFVAKQPEDVRLRASKAWKLSRHTNYTRGATHFDNIKEFGMPRWARGMVRTAVIADMTYFKERG